MTELLVKDLTVEYTTAGYVVRPLDKLNLHASPGEFVVLLGPSGSGKTTLLSCLAGILTPTAGTIRVGDRDVTSMQRDELVEYRRSTVGIVFQAFNLIPSLTALENVSVPLHLSGTNRKVAAKRAEELLHSVGLSERLHHLPAHLSGGQQQRVAIARGLAHDPPILLADEPTAHLDYVQAEGVLSLLRSLADRDRIVLVSTHDARMLPLADRVIDLAPKVSMTRAQPTKMTIDEGQVVFEQNTRGDLVYIVEEGEIEIYRVAANGAEESVAIIKAGDYFGELGPLLGFPRTASARGYKAATLTAYNVSDFRELAKSDPRLSAAKSRRVTSQE